MFTFLYGILCSIRHFLFQNFPFTDSPNAWFIFFFFLFSKKKYIPQFFHRFHSVCVSEIDFCNFCRRQIYLPRLNYLYLMFFYSIIVAFILSFSYCLERALTKISEIFISLESKKFSYILFILICFV